MTKPNSSGGGGNSSRPSRGGSKPLPPSVNGGGGGGGKKPLRTVRALKQPDNAVLRPPLETSVAGLRQAVRLFETSTPEVVHLMSYECDIIYECRVCKNLFRSVANFISHKRIYCTRRFNHVQNSQVENENAQEQNLPGNMSSFEKEFTEDTAHDEKINEDNICKEESPEDVRLNNNGCDSYPQQPDVITSSCVDSNSLSTGDFIVNCSDDLDKGQEEKIFENMSYSDVTVGEDQDTNRISINNESNEQETRKNEEPILILVDVDVDIYSNREDENHTVTTPNVTSTGTPKKGRKRKYPEQNRQQRKKNCIQNRQYIDQRGKLHNVKEFCQYLCKCNCFDRVGEENIKQEFCKFYSVESHEAQRALICSMVREEEIKRKRVKDSNRKTKSRIYQVCGVVVCKFFFMQSFRISSSKINSALKAIKRPEGVRDLRGIAGGHNKLEEDRVRQVIDHITKSHYRGSTTEQEFLNPATTLAKMYELYKGEVQNPVCISSYKRILFGTLNSPKEHMPAMKTDMEASAAAENPESDYQC